MSETKKMLHKNEYTVVVDNEIKCATVAKPKILNCLTAARQLAEKGGASLIQLQSTILQDVHEFTFPELETEFSSQVAQFTQHFIEKKKNSQHYL